MTAAGVGKVEHFLNLWESGKNKKGTNLREYESAGCARASTPGVASGLFSREVHASLKTHRVYSPEGPRVCLGPPPVCFTKFTDVLQLMLGVEVRFKVISHLAAPPMASPFKSMHEALLPASQITAADVQVTSFFRDFSCVVGHFPKMGNCISFGPSDFGTF